jgi:hypothetical protein
VSAGLKHGVPKNSPYAAAVSGSSDFRKMPLLIYLLL